MEQKFKDQKVLSYSSFFLSSLLNETNGNFLNRYGQVRFNSGKEVDIFAKDFLLMLLNLNNHWSAVFVVRPILVMLPGTDGDNCPCIVHADPANGLHSQFTQQLTHEVKK